MYPSRTPESGAFRSVVPTYGQLEQEVKALRNEAAFYLALDEAIDRPMTYGRLEQEVRSLYDQVEFYKKELEDALRLVEKLKKELGHEQG